ncbi:MAG: sugar phosphate isomerase/epimerase [Anaerolineaceae bacterium]|nr:MAG: sugar phosphate isomerase/epimerase [Anaerolineaceae bacterium]
MGYDGVELAGLYGYTPEEIRDILNNIGLIPISAHVSYAEFMEDIEATVNRYATIGCKFLAIPYLTVEYRYRGEKYQELLKNIPLIANACQKKGITLLYHNHDFEFEKTERGNYVLDELFEQFSDEIIQTEIDTCWVKYAGVEPTGYIRKYSGRSPIIHLKDYAIDEKFDYRPLGHGIQDIPAILEEALKVGTEWIVVEQDNHSQRSPLENTLMSREYLKTLGW